MQGVELQAVVNCTGSGYSQAVRNAALSLLSRLAELQPQSTLNIVLEVSL